MYFLTDQLATPRLGIDQGQAVVWKWESDAYGAISPQGSVTINLRYPGQYADRESGWFYNWNRVYDPEGGRYWTSDLIGLKGGLNTYTYVGENPTSYVDFYGLAYFAYRRLHNVPFMFSCPLLDKFNLAIAHEQLFFEDGKQPSNVGFSVDGEFLNDSPIGYHKTDGGYDDCIMREAVARTPIPGHYSVIGQNCQDWADAVRATYKRIVNDPSVQQQCSNSCPLEDPIENLF